MVPPGETVSELAVFMIDKSAEAAETGTVTEEELLSGLGSSVVEDTKAVFVILPEACGLTMPRIRTVSAALGARIPRERAPAQGRKVAPPSREYTGSMSRAGMVSVSMTASAESGPRLETRMV